MKVYQFLLITSLIITASLSFSQNDKKSRKVERVTETINSISNSHIRIFSSDPSGRFSIVTSENKNILFYDFKRDELFTGHLNLRIDDSIYSNEPKIAAQTGTNKMTGTTQKTNTYFEYNYEIPSKKISLQQRVTLVKYGSYYGVLIKFTIKNNDGVKHNAGLLHEFDPQINNNDGAVFYTNFGPVASESLFTKNNLPVYWQASESARIDSGMIGQGYLKGLIPFTDDEGSEFKTTLTPPDFFYIADWEKCSTILWDINPKNDEKYYDSGLLLKWDTTAINPNSSLTYSTYIGLGQVIYNNYLLTSISVPEIKFTEKKYQPNPFEFEVMVQNQSDNKISNIQSKITLPSLLSLDSGITPGRLTPPNLEPYEIGFVKYKLKTGYTLDSQSLPVPVEISSSGNNTFKINGTVNIPPAIGVDFFKPVFDLIQKNCSIYGSIQEKQLYDQGLDSILIDSTQNISVFVDKYNRGIRETEFIADLIDINKYGYAKIRAIDVAGNTNTKEFEIIPKFAGFDTLLNFRPGKEVHIPFKLKNFTEALKDTGLRIGVKFNKQFMTPAMPPYSIENSQSMYLNPTDLIKTDSTVQINLSGDCNFSNGAIIYFNFKVANQPPDSSFLNIETFKLTNEKFCLARTSAILTRFYPDSLAPRITIKPKGSKLSCSLSDDGADETGIYSVSLFYSNNAVLSYDRFEPGKKNMEVFISAKDSLLPLNGILRVIDGCGNLTDKYFQTSPMFATIDSIRAKNNDIIYVVPSLQSQYSDTTIRNFEFSLHYDTSSLKLSPPFFDTQNTSSKLFTILLDTSKKGYVKITGDGNTALKMGNIIRLKFQVIPGEDKRSSLDFDYMTLNNGEKIVFCTNSFFFRINSDKIPPQIKFEQRRNRLYINITEKRENDIGISNVEFKNIINFPVEILPTNSFGNILRYFEVVMLDSTKTASITVTATDFLGNKVDSSFIITPMRIELPPITRGREFDTLSIPIRIYDYKSNSVNRIKFNVEYDDLILTAANPYYSSKGTLTEKENISVNKKGNSLSFDIPFGSVLGNETDILVKVNFMVLSGLPAFSNIRISNVSVNNDSLCMNSVDGQFKRYFHDTLPPVITAWQTGCGWKSYISDTRKNDSKLVEIGLDSNINFKDTLSFSPSFHRLDSTTTVFIYPKSSKLNSSAILYAKDYENNITRVKIEIKPLSLKLPEIISLYPDSSGKIPVYLDGFTDQKITNMNIGISYDPALIRIDSIGRDGSICRNSKFTATRERQDLISFNILPAYDNSTNKLLTLYVTALKGSGKISPLKFETYSFNHDTLCLNTSNGLIERIGVDSVYISIDSSLTGRFGSDISIPVNIKSVNMTADLTGFLIQIKYNSSLLNPSAVITNGAAAQNCSVNIINKENPGSITIEAKGKLDLTKYNILCRLKTRVLVGNTDRTSLDINSFRFYSDSLNIPEKIYINIHGGFFMLDSLSEWQKGLIYKGNVLLQNSPNPFNLSTRISYNIQEKSFVHLKIYDILGRLIAEPIKEIREAGTHDFNYNAFNMPSGVYFYKLETDYFTQIKKMLLLK
jgi:hypothetical protein